MAGLKHYHTILELDRLLVGGRKIIAPEIQVGKTGAWFDAWYKTAIEGRGMFMPRGRREALRQRLVFRPGLTNKREALELARALCNPTPIVHEHVQDRLDNNSNAFVNWSGPTGTCKSSCSLHFGLEAGVYASSVKTRQDLHARLCIEAWDVPKVLAEIGPCEVAFKDENRRTSGQGSTTDLKNVLNLQDTIRASQKNLHIHSPELEDHTATELHVRMFARTRDDIIARDGTGYGLGLVYVDGELVGTHLEPIATATTWSWYMDWKEPLVDASQALEAFGSDRLGGYVDKMLERTPDLLWHLRGRKKGEVEQICRLNLRTYNVEQQLAQQVGQLVFQILEEVDQGCKMPEDALRDLSAMTAVTFGDATKHALENLYHGPQA